MRYDTSVVHQRLGSEEAARMKAGPWVCVDLDFFDAHTRVWVRSAAEAAQWRHFYKHHLHTGASGDAVVEVWLEVTGAPHTSFLQSIVRQDAIERTTYVQTGGEVELWSRSEGWSTVPSPVPPFQLPPLSERVMVLNASAVQPADGGAILVAAPRYNGKSTIANAIVERGGTPLADNLAIVDVAHGRVLPYLSPTGIRAETVDKVPGLRRAVSRVPEHWITQSNVTGAVYLVHFDDIYDHPPAAPTPIQAFIYPTDRRHSGVSTTLSRLGAEAARQRAEAFLVCYDDEPRHGPTLSRFVDRAVSFELEYDLSSCDVGAVVHRIASAIEEASAGGDAW